MPLDAFRFKVFSRRVFIVSSIQVFCFFVVIIRLFKLQILDYRYFREKSDGNRIKANIIPPSRGLIKDTDGKVVAFNSEYYRIILKKKNYKIDMQSIANLSSVLKFKDEGKKQLLREYRRNKNQKEVIIYRYLTRKELVDIEFHLHQLPNLLVGVGKGRLYTHPLAFSNLLGYVIQVPSSSQKKQYIVHPDIRIGAEGMEKFYNTDLIGKHGIQYTEVNAGGFKIADIKTIPPVSGKDITISFNSLLQIFTYELCKTTKASAVLLDIQTGEVRVLLSTPSFDINLLSKKVDNEAWNELLNDPRKPLLNRPLQSAFAPGSIFKLITAISALEDGYNPSHIVKCPGKIYMYGSIRHCWLKRGHGNLDLHSAIKHSCNITFYNIGNTTKLERFHETSKEFSLGEEFANFEFKNQNIGLNPSEAWKKKHLKEPWFIGDTINLSIGQGFVRYNALQLAVMIARIASHGKKIEPTLKVLETPPNFKNININPSHVAFVKKALFEATNSPGGTSYFSRIKEKGMEFSGKTGTAQVVSKFLEKHEYNDLNRPHGLFVGFAPFEDPKFAVSIVVENGGFGSSAAAPVGKNLLYFAQLLDKGRISDAKKFATSLGILIPSFNA